MELSNEFDQQYQYLINDITQLKLIHEEKEMSLKAQSNLIKGWKSTMFILEGRMSNLNLNKTFEFTLDMEGPIFYESTKFMESPKCVDRELDIWIIGMNFPMISKREMLVKRNVDKEKCVACLYTTEDERFPAAKGVIRPKFIKLIRMEQVENDIYFRDVSTLDLSGWIMPGMINMLMRTHLTKDYKEKYKVIKSHLGDC